jgi:hypothetical protein
MNLIAFTSPCCQCGAEYEAYAIEGQDPASIRASGPKCRHSGRYGFWLAPLYLLGTICAIVWSRTGGVSRKVKLSPRRG